MQRKRLFPRKSGFLKHSKMSEPIGLYRKDQSCDMQKETKDATSRLSLVSQCCQLWRQTNKQTNLGTFFDVTFKKYKLSNAVHSSVKI